MLYAMNIKLPILGESGTLTISPGKILAIGLNYNSHIEESASLKVKSLDNAETPEEPILFNKTPNVLIGPNEPIVIPGCIHDYEWEAPPRTDYEGELVVIIGRRGRYIEEKNALNHIYGYTCGNDISQRNIQNSDRAGWFRGKSFDTFGPIGPAILPAGKLDNPQNLKIETRQNGKVVQSATTGYMIFPRQQDYRIYKPPDDTGSRRPDIYWYTCRGGAHRIGRYSGGRNRKDRRVEKYSYE